MTITLTIQNAPGGAQQPDLTPQLTRAIMSSNLHGDEALQLSARLSMPSAFERYDRAGTPHAVVTDGAALPFQGRVEDIAVRGDGLELTAFGYQRALTDARYNALWSVTSVAAWRPVIPTEIATATPDRFTFDTQNRVSIAPQKNATFGTTVAAKQAYMCYISPDDGVRGIVGVQFDFVLAVPAAPWRAGFVAQDAAFATLSVPWIYSPGAGTAIGSIFATFAAAPIVSFFMDYAAADAVYVGETGTNFLHITNLRLVTTTANMVNTAFTVAHLAGVNVTATVGSTARMYVGMRLFIGGNVAAGGESVIVKQVLNSTQFVADFAAGEAIGVVVQGFVVYADEIVRELISVTSTQNSTQLLPDTSQVASPALDLLDESYEDAIPATILDHLITFGDNATIPNQWEWGVTGLRTLYYRVQGATAQTWYVDVTSLTVQRSLNQLFNSVYAVYRDATNRTLRGAVSTNAASVARFGITRTLPVTASTTSLVQANVLRDATLADDADPPPRFGLTFAAIYNSVGGRVPLWLPRAGDTIVIRNLPPTVSVSIDQIRSFRIARTTCDLIARTLTIEPETPLPSVQALLAHQT
jgi:hypothetical protein